MDDEQSVGARVAAARRMAGLDQKQLAARIDTPKLGFKNVGKIERGERKLEAHEAPLFAEALGVPVSFFYEPVQAADGDSALLARLEEKLDGGLVEQQSLRDQIAHQNENLAAQTELLRELKTLAGEIKSLVAVLQDAKIIERSAAAAVRSLPEWPAPPGAKPAPAQEPQRATGTTSRGGRQGRGQRRNTA